MNIQRNSTQQQGFTLVEVLVAVVITMIGLLGVASLQSVAVSNTKIAADRSVAATQLTNLSARMKSSSSYWQSVPVGFDIQISSTGVISDVGAGTAGADLEAATEDCSSQVCTTNVEAVSYQLKAWMVDGTVISQSSGVADRLAAPSARVTRVGNGFPILLDLTVTWNQKIGASGLNMAAVFTQTGTSNANSRRSISYSMRIQP